MARGRGRGRRRGGGSRSSSSGSGDSTLADAFDALLNPVQSLTKGMEAAVEGVVKFSKNTLEGAAEIKRAEAAYESLKEKLAGPALEGLANLASPGAGSFVGSLRRGLGGVAATGNAAQELEDISAQAAFQGLPLDKDLQKSIFPLIQARRDAVEAARQQAADVTGSEIKRQGEAAAEFFGVGDILRGFFTGGNARTP